MMFEGRMPSSAWLALLVFADGFFVVLFALRGVTALAVLGVVLAAIPVAGSFTRRPTALPWIAPAAGLVASSALALGQGLSSGSPGETLLGGLLLGSPLTVLAAILRWSRTPEVLLPVTFAGLVDLLTLSAAVNRLATDGLAPTPGALATAFGEVTWDQTSGLSGLFAGNPSVSLPVQSLSDPVFAGLALLALVGVFLALFAPEARGDETLRPEPTAIFPPVVFAVVAAGVFELVAGRAPNYALLGLAAGVLAVVVAILWLARKRAMPSAGAAVAPDPKHRRAAAPTSR
jgi:hypothetical protein